MPIQPLYWPDSHQRPSLWRRLLVLWHFGTDWTTWHELRHQMAARPDNDADLWEGWAAPPDLRDTVSTIIAEELEWPQARFVPDDPCELIFWDPTPDLLILCARKRIEAAVTVADGVWEGICALSYGQFLTRVQRR